MTDCDFSHHSFLSLMFMFYNLQALKYSPLRKFIIGIGDFEIHSITLFKIVKFISKSLRFSYVRFHDTDVFDITFMEKLNTFCCLKKILRFHF